MFATAVLFLMLLAPPAVLGAWRWSDLRAECRAWDRLGNCQGAAPRLFQHSMLDGLPEAAQRFFRFAIEPGTAVHTVPIVDQAVDLYVDEEGGPIRARFQRWSNANSSKTYRLQPFGAYLSAFGNFGG